ncbi:MAG TPA: hypothetical protein VJT31_37770 [Rugosimonospora sp.]|nr:hypothetical protein [Rugosimonospora sp.]
MIGGYEEYPVLHLVPVQGEHGVELPEQLYRRWKDARAELDAVQHTVIGYLREHGGRAAIPEELWESRDRRPPIGGPGTAQDTP